MSKLLTPYTKGNLNFKNHLVMAPMTRSRAIGNLPNDLMAEYYGQRNGAGLIITEGVAPAPEGLGYPRIPGVFTQAQVEGWKATANAVHKGGSKIFMQLMHTGRIGHGDNVGEGVKVMGPSAVKAAGQIYSDTSGMVDHHEPEAFTTSQVKEVIESYVTAAKNAVEAGFDGVELHGANGYLIEQFLNPNVNHRTDEYGGSIANRAKFALEIAAKTAVAIGKEKVGIRFSPFNTYNDQQPYATEEVFETYTYLAAELNKLEIAYIHINLNPAITNELLQAIRANYQGTLILCGGFTPETAEQKLTEGVADLIAFGALYLANPDLDKRIAAKAAFNSPDFSTAFMPGPKGYTDYPTL